MKKQIRVIYKRVGFDPVEVTIENELETLQRMIGGDIETVPWYFYNGMVMIVDEEGKLNNRPVNFAFRGDVIVGSAMWVGTDIKKGEFIDMQEEIETK